MKVKTTIKIESELWKKFSIRVIEKEGHRKKNEVIENLIKAYVEVT
jgi:metal-responsive CopG/Arc/MetJ family transcriptional regulator